ncbi:MAG: PEP-CTERM sorting domain-containing protein [Planctomycetes bacterium]|nr:PEP-CTERM sorting domain-containing protein [Planctomycetota bacterium]
MTQPYRRVGRSCVALRLHCRIMPVGVRRWPGVFALLALLLAMELPAHGAQIGFAARGDLPIIGVTPSKSTGANLSSRGRGAPAGEAAIAAAGGVAEGDSYDAIGFYSAGPTSFLLDSEPNTHTFGLPFDEDAGDNFFSLVPMRIQGEDRGADAIPNQQGTNLITVSYFTADMSPLLPLGSVFSPLGTIINGWGFDVGFLDGIDIGPTDTFVIHDSGIQFIDNTIVDPAQRVVADFAMDDDSTPPNGGLAGGGRATVQGRAGGIAIDEMVLYWDITVIPGVPEPSTSVLMLLGIVGLAVGRIRRRAVGTNSRAAYLG